MFGRKKEIQTVRIWVPHDWMIQPNCLWANLKGIEGSWGPGRKSLGHLQTWFRFLRVLTKAITWDEWRYGRFLTAGYSNRTGCMGRTCMLQMMCTFACTYILYLYNFIYAYIHTYREIDIRIYIHVYTFTYTYIYVDIYIYTCYTSSKYSDVSWRPCKR